ncbi:MAG TPA: hypothetical protein VF581_13020 [Flavobacterium sp.]|jgi:hypothetical protein
MADDDSDIFAHALREIIEIQNGAKLEKESRETIADGFEMEILKTQKEKAIEELKRFNKVFVHKRFDFDPDFEHNHFTAAIRGYTCRSYFDKVDVKINHRIEFHIGFEPSKLLRHYEGLQERLKGMEYRFEGFKFYWNIPHLMYLYDDSRHPLWKKGNEEKQRLQLTKKGIEEVVEFIKELK